LILTAEKSFKLALDKSFSLQIMFEAAHFTNQRCSSRLLISLQCQFKEIIKTELQQQNRHGKHREPGKCQSCCREAATDMYLVFSHVQPPALLQPVHKPDRQ
jgi:hypothetical protein